MIKKESDKNASKDFRELSPFSITHLLRLCEEQSILMAEVDDQIGQFVQQISEYEQERYEKDVYIRKLEDELKREGKVLWQ